MSSLADWREGHYLICGIDITERKEQELEVRRSRARLVEAGEAERRRLERNLHDGAQQRLVSLSLALRLAQAKLATDPDAAAQILDRAGDELALALEELRELARGIHPAMLTDRGLTPRSRPSRRGRRSRSSCRHPRSGSRRPSRPPRTTSSSEALANVVKYAEAARASASRSSSATGTSSSRSPTTASAAPTPQRGSGLRGLVDRVDALDGPARGRQPRGRGNARSRRRSHCRRAT